MKYLTHTLSKEQQNELDAGYLLPVMEQFYTIQGEGFHTGKAAYFIRIGGCDVGCHWCDVKESWDASVHPLTTVESLIESVKSYKAQSVVITGGEPLIYNLEALTTALKKEGIATFIETSGAYKLSGKWDWICLSPKKTMPPLPEVYQQASELKIIVYNQHDFVWAEEQATKVSQNCHLFLQPEWSKSTLVLNDIIEYVKTHPRWMISLQTHKFMHIP